MMREQWKAMEGAYAEGLTRAIGVSNFCADCLACIAGEAEVFPHVNQMRMHAGMGGGDPKGVVSATERTGAVLQAYQPLAHGEGSLLTDPTVRRIAASLNKSAAQVAPPTTRFHSPITFTRPNHPACQVHISIPAALFTSPSLVSRSLSSCHVHTMVCIPFEPTSSIAVFHAPCVTFTSPYHPFWHVFTAHCTLAPSPTLPCAHLHPCCHAHNPCCHVRTSISPLLSCRPAFLYTAAPPCRWR